MREFSPVSQPLSVHGIDVAVSVLDGIAPADAWPAEWDSLAGRCAGAATFVSRPWVVAWVQAYAQTCPLRAIELRVNGRLAGAMWLYRHNGHPQGPRWLTVGSGNSDRLDPLLDAELAEDLSPPLIDALAEVSSDAPVELQQITADSAFARAAMRDARCTIAEHDPCLVVDLGGVQHAHELLKKGMRYDLRRSRKAMEEHGCTIEEAAPETVDGLIDALVELHTARWRARGEAGVLSDRATCDMHRAVARQTVGKELVLRALRCDSTIIACVYGFRSNGVESCYLNGFDPEWSWLHPGKLMLADTIDRAIAAGIRRLDMLRGREEYKYRWPVIEAPCVRIGIGTNDEEAGRSLDHR